MYYTVPPIGFLIFAVAGLVGLAFLAIMKDVDSKSLILKVSIVVVRVATILSWVLIMIGFIVTENVPTGKYKYQITISDEVNFTEFNSKYEVLEQNGKIFTVIEKER